jgi:hypothetical protein
MYEYPTQASHRLISYIALIQSGVVIAGTLVVGAMLKVWGYRDNPHDPDFARFAQFNPVALYVRHYGLTLLLLPVLWVALALLSRRATRRPWIELTVQAMGVGMILYGLYFYFRLGFTDPNSRPPMELKAGN